MSQMLIVMAEAVFETPSDMDRILALSQPLIAATRKEDGCISYVFARDSVLPSTMHVIEVWRDQAAIDAHEQTAHFRSYQTDAMKAGAKLVSFTMQRYDAALKG